METSFAVAAVVFVLLVTAAAFVFRLGTSVDADAYLALRQGRRQFVALQTPDGQLVYPQVPGIPEWYFSESAMTVRPTSEKTRSQDLAYMQRYNDLMYRMIRQDGTLPQLQQEVQQVARKLGVA